MNMIKFLLLLLFPALLQAQHDEKGIQFKHLPSWKAALDLAKKENKPIFVDCYTTWCGPCKYMSANIFTNDTVAKYFNKNFINMKVQLDSIKQDPEDIKAWYTEAREFNKIYKVIVYPTYLIINPNGELVHKFVGAMQSKEFIANAGNGLNPATQFYTLDKKFKAGNRDTALVRTLLNGAAASYEDPSAYFDAYVATQPSMFTKDNVALLNQFTTKTKSSSFELIRKNVAAYDKIEGAGKANKLLVRIIVSEHMLKLYPSRSVTEQQEAGVEFIKTNYPDQAEEVFATAKVLYFNATRNWKLLGPALLAYLPKYNDRLTDPSQLNDLAWNIFENISDPTLLKAALDMSRKSIQPPLENEAAYLDTYANILYRLGKTSEAIEWETKAMNAAQAFEKSGYEETLEKIKKGEKTWKE